ncbi:M56 family metallopeptidase [Flagellimonas zhangzhouensis]|uniref:TonB family C-terminal domain-containing protein n=1 Tax=Flagellimonas zhangzhouensis TaxID=1073328 RepID=A0A1H2WNT0_9FLAO|nr:M56 family metallopeptidase [Allomuricauda zhangzhouensis]SDQ23165.1 TonB family C-terminal domain-containing protein [Allomuricauda zhangzhouensis]SDW82251.1 TonB family C-terminal domain-containing protein [Allomuricauda zhangzhouensis]
MITYILESLVFQLVFLLTYDLFLKKETFFQWNRVYLLGTFALSLVLPWIKVEALQTTMPQEFGATTVYLTQLNGVVLGPEVSEPGFLASIPWPYWVLGAGCFLASLWFAYKLLRLNQMRKNGSVTYYNDFTKISVPKSAVAFSFFRNIFMGENIKKDKEPNILAHELVHVKQLHSLDLLFFEMARILFWFNPLVYVYQSRVAELHEFIADAKAVKHNKQAHFEILLSEAFNTQNISFVNQFFNKSLIKKRIVMLQKKQSKAVWQLKYVLLLPMVLGMLVYTSCESDSSSDSNQSAELSLEERLVNLNSEIEGKDSLTENERNQIAKMAQTMIDRMNKSAKEVNGWTVKAGIGNPPTTDSQEQSESVPFATIDEVPVFPGCENAADPKECFQEKLVEHIKKNFRYPEAAQEQGIQGRVSVVFTIDVNGDISSIKKRGPHELLENEAVRIIERLPKMQPGRHEGKVMNVPYAIPITFRLQTQPEGTTVNGSKDYMLVSGSKISKQGKTVFEGVVTDRESLGLSGVIVSIEGKEAGVMSNFNGVFSLEVDEGDVVKFQYAGLPNKMVKVADF